MCAWSDQSVYRSIMNRHFTHRRGYKVTFTTLTAILSRNPTYVTAKNPTKNRAYFSVWLRACVFIFILGSVAAFLFRVLCETERLPESDSLKPDPAVR